MRKVYILPNLFTSANLFLGMMAIIESVRYLNGDKDSAINACWFILAAAVMDALDGKVARLMRAESEFGIQYDSLADLISFGAAPAFLMYISFFTDIPNQHFVGFATVMYVICGALRLARYNVQVTDEEKKSFTGLPIPAAACMVISTYLLLQKYEISWLIKGLPLLMMALALLMVSTISYPSLKSLPLGKAKSFQALFYIVLIGCMIYGLKDYKEVMVFALFLVYLVFGVFIEVHQRITGRRPAISEVLEQSAIDGADE